MKTLEEICKSIENTSSSLSEAADEIVHGYTSVVDGYINDLNNRIVDLSNEDIRQYMLQLSCEAYSLSEIKEHNDLKKECATMIVKLSQAETSLNTAGTVEAKKNSAMLYTENEQIANILYTSVADRLKIKLDEIHRVVDALKSVMISRSSEAKLTTEVDMM